MPYGPISSASARSSIPSHRHNHSWLGTQIRKIIHTLVYIHPFNDPFPGLPRWTDKVNQSGFYWSKRQRAAVASAGAICKSAPRSRQITMPAPHHSVFYRPDAIPATQPTASKHWRQTKKSCQMYSLSQATRAHPAKFIPVSVALSQLTLQDHGHMGLVHPWHACLSPSHYRCQGNYCWTYKVGACLQSLPHSEKLWERIIHTKFNFSLKWEPKIYLHIINECILYTRFYGTYLMHSLAYIRAITRKKLNENLLNKWQHYGMHKEISREMQKSSDRVPMRSAYSSDWTGSPCLSTSLVRVTNAL